MLWHIYAQEEGAHWEKLNAFLQLYSEGLSAPAREALEAMWRAWNAGDDVKQSWSILQLHWQELTVHAENWCFEQLSRRDLAAALVQFQQNWI